MLTVYPVITAKIRRLYDVANVLVSVGLIEKLQLSNSRKPVFRWKTRSSTPNLTASQSTANESENTSVQQTTVKSETMSPVGDEENMDVTKSPQPSDSDMSDEGSDSQSDASSCGSKRKQTEQDGSDVSMSDGESSVKRSKRISSMDKKSVGKSLLRMDENNEPIHPQAILAEQQEQVKLFMQQYIREYVDYLAAHQKLPDTNTPATRAESGGLATPSASKSVTATHGTPVSLPSLAGSIQDLLLSESPQSVADMVAARVLSNPFPLVSTSPVAAEPEVEANPRPLILRVVNKQATSTAKTPPPAVSIPKATAVAPKDEERYDAPRNLIRSLQPRSQL